MTRGRAELSTRRVAVVLGSPRRDGNSTCLATAIATGALAMGCEIETFRLHEMDISFCNACNQCRTATARDCVLEDGMKPLYQAIRAADALVVATPIYWWTMSAQTKVFLDRCYALGGPQGSALARKEVVIVLTYAGADPLLCGVVNALRTFQDGFGALGARIVGTIHGRADRAGAIRSNRELMEKSRRLGQKLGSRV